MSKINEDLLYYASYEGDNQKVEQFINDGANVNSTNNKGFSPLFTASEFGHSKVVETLIKNGAKINIVNKGFTPLYQAVHKGQTEVVKILIKNGGDVHLTYPKGWTLLMVAVDHNHIEIVRLLIEAKAELNAENNQFFTPLILAISENNLAIVKLLVQGGADLNKKDEKGLRPLDFALALKNQDIIDFLIQNGAILTDPPPIKDSKPQKYMIIGVMVGFLIGGPFGSLIGIFLGFISGKLLRHYSEKYSSTSVPWANRLVVYGVNGVCFGATIGGLIGIIISLLQNGLKEAIETIAISGWLHPVVSWSSATGALICGCLSLILHNFNGKFIDILVSSILGCLIGLTRYFSIVICGSVLGSFLLEKHQTGFGEILPIYFYEKILLFVPLSDITKPLLCIRFILCGIYIGILLLGIIGILAGINSEIEIQKGLYHNQYSSPK